MSSSSWLELDAPAKLNLFLEVTGRRDDGYHEIDSILRTIDLCDRVAVRESDRIELEVSGDPSVPAGPENLAWRAAAALGVGARIRLRKRIPPGAGLGGGSSDAAAVLLALDRLYGLGLGAEGLHAHAAALGADVPFFLRGGAARCRGVGDRVQPLSDLPGGSFLLALPQVFCSTAEVYGALRPGLTPKPRNATVFLDRYRESQGSEPVFFNRLQEVAERLEPRLARVREALERRFGVPFTMTGSGSAYFGALRGEGSLPEEMDAGGVDVRLLMVVGRD